MKRLTLLRRWYDDERTIGELYHRSDFICFTLEPGKADADPRVGTGFYSLVRHGWRGEPVKFQRTWVLVGRDTATQVGAEDFEPGLRSAVLIHTGNRDDSTRGCILPGMSIGRLQGETAVLSSADAMTKIRSLIGDADACLVIRGG